MESTEAAAAARSKLQATILKILKCNIKGDIVEIGCFKGEISKLIIGDNNVIREYTTIHLPTRWSEKTIIGNNCYLMVLSHVAHDCVIEDDVIMTNNVVLGGHVYIMRGCQLGFGTIIHQYQTLGSYCMFGMGTIITSKETVVPGGLWYGNPGKFSRNNIIGLNRHKVDDKTLNNEYQRYRSIKDKRSKYRYE